MVTHNSTAFPSSAAVFNDIVRGTNTMVVPMIAIVVVVVIATVETRACIGTVVVVSTVVNANFTLVYVDALITGDTGLVIEITMTPSD